ncbi:MAG TPA: hypothetical protein VK031_06150, partial [Tissierellaceae bacterium]|nr:hypothetical protein [Tissierellaceae bacterium]
MGSINSLFSKDLKILNLGTSKFEEDLKEQNQEVIQLDWKPAAGGDIELLKIIDRLAGNEEIVKANKEAVDRMINSHPILVDIDQAINVIPGMKENMILHSGPPIQWERMSGPMRGAIIGALIYEGKAETEEEAVSLVE